MQDLRKQNSEIDRFIREVERSDKLSGSNFQSLFVTPIQRIPRYRLLLISLLEATPPSHPDFTHVTKAVEAISRLCEQLNELKGRADDRETVSSLETYLKDVLPKNLSLSAADGRTFIALYFVMHINRGKRHPVACLLFTDMCIVVRLMGSNSVSALGGVTHEVTLRGHALLTALGPANKLALVTIVSLGDMSEMLLSGKSVKLARTDGNGVLELDAHSELEAKQFFTKVDTQRQQLQRGSQAPTSTATASIGTSNSSPLLSARSSSSSGT